MRPANMVTAVADIIAGVAIVGFLTPQVWTSDLFFDIILLLVSTAGLYSGGIVYNDVFDYDQDKINRPERVLPSGRLTLGQAKLLGGQLFAIGVVAAFLVSIRCGFIAVGIVLLALLYDKFGKHHTILGPINMGLWLLTITSGGMTFVSAAVFAIGVTFFWPTMLGFVAEYLPETGALGLSIMGGAGMLSVSIVLPIMGNLMDNASATEALRTMSILPAILIVCFLGLSMYIKKRNLIKN